MSRGSAPPSRRRRLPAGLGLVISAIALVGCALWISQQDAPRLPTSTTGIIELVAAVAVYAGATVVRGWQWHRLLVRSRLSHAKGDAFALVR